MDVHAQGRTAVLGPEDRVVLRSTEWDGPAPQPGAVVLADAGPLVVQSVAEGPGLGQWRLTCRAPQVIQWT